MIPKFIEDIAAKEKIPVLINLDKKPPQSKEKIYLGYCEKKQEMLLYLNRIFFECRLQSIDNLSNLAIVKIFMQKIANRFLEAYDNNILTNLTVNEAGLVVSGIYIRNRGDNE